MWIVLPNWPSINLFSYDVKVKHDSEDFLKKQGLIKIDREIVHTISVIILNIKSIVIAYFFCNGQTQTKIPCFCGITYESFE